MRRWTTCLICALFGCGTTGGAQPDSSDGAVYGPGDAAVEEARFDRGVVDAAIQRAGDAAENSCLAAGGVCAIEGTCPVGRTATSAYGAACGVQSAAANLGNPCCVPGLADAATGMGTDAGGDVQVDAGPFACQSRTCAADGWCVYPCCGIVPGCFAFDDGGVCPSGTLSCGNDAGCRPDCYTPSCSKNPSISTGCTVTGREVHCTCG